MSPRSGSRSKMLILLMAGLSLQQLSSAEQPSPTLGPPGTFQICGGDSGQPCPSVSAEGTLDSAAASGQPGPASIEAAGAFDPSTPCPTTSLQTLLNQGVTYAQIAAQARSYCEIPTLFPGTARPYLLLMSTSEKLRQAHGKDGSRCHITGCPSIFRQSRPCGKERPPTNKRIS